MAGKEWEGENGKGKEGTRERTGREGRKKEGRERGEEGMRMGRKEGRDGKRDQTQPKGWMGRVGLTSWIVRWLDK